MRQLRTAAPTLLALSLVAPAAIADDGPADLPPVSERARKVHEAGMLFDGHNDLPWRLRAEGDMALDKINLSERLDEGMTDIPRLREGGLKAQFWSVYIPSEHPDPARTVAEQVDLVHRMVDRYPETFALAGTADEVEAAVRDGKVASLLGIEGGVAIENDLALLRNFYRLGVRYMTLTHNKTLDWADAATDAPKSGGLSPRGEQIVREMNRLGMLVDLSHVSPETMDDALRVSKAPVIFSHSSAFAIAPHPRNVPDDILKRLPENGGVVMVNFFSGFVVPEYAKESARIRRELRETYPDPKEFAKALDSWYESAKFPRGTVSDVADHIDHLVEVAGIDHVGIGSDFDGISSAPVGLDDVSDYPRLTEELLKRGYPEADVHKILGGNALRVLREAEKVAARLKSETKPEVDPAKPEKD